MKRIHPLIWLGMALALAAMAVAAYIWNRQQQKFSQDLLRLIEARTDQQIIELAEKMVARYPRVPSEYRSQVKSILAAAYGREGRFREMEKMYLEALADNPYNHEALNNLAYGWACRGENMDSAQAYSLRAVEMALEELPAKKLPGLSDEQWQEMVAIQQGTYLDTYGWVLYKKAEYDSSLQVMRRAWKLYQDPTISYHYGLALYQQGQVDSAIVRLATAVAAKTGDSLEATEELRRIYYQRHRSLKGLADMVAAAWESLAENRVQTMALESGRLVGSPAPDFILKDLEGRRHSLSAVRGRVVILDFWAQWCATCRKTMPLVQKVWEEYQGQEVVIWGIDLDDPHDLDRAQEFLSRESIDFPILLGGKMGQGMDRVYQVTGLPTTLVIDRQGVIRFRHIGYRENLDKLLSANIELLLKEP